MMKLSTLVTEIETVLNLRSLTFVSTDDVEEPLTPSHHLFGYRVLSNSDDPDYDESANDLGRKIKHLREILETLEERILA